MNDKRVAARGLVFDLARVTIELNAPMAIGALGDDPLQDSPIVVDANGLPTIPGPSLAGALRDYFLEAYADKAFGHQFRNNSQASLVEVSWAQVHDEHNCPVPVRKSGRRNLSEFLNKLSIPAIRDHVRLSGHRSAADHGKFDVSYAPAGCRFTFELVVHQDAGVSLDELVGALQSPLIRLGKNVRRGYGAFGVHCVKFRRFDLREHDDFRAFAAYPRDLSKSASGSLTEFPLGPRTTPEDVIYAEIRLSPVSTWTFGRADDEKSDYDVDLLPYREDRIQWRAEGGNETGGFESYYVLPGSAIKGALRHRAEFHFRRKHRQFWGELGTTLQGSPTELVTLFGELKSNEGGAAGRVRIDDYWIPVAQAKLQQFDHVSIDQFSGGPLDGHLFSELVFFGIDISVNVLVDARASRGGSPQLQPAREALGLALRDLCSGRLALGAASSRGHGFFRAQQFGTFVAKIAGATNAAGGAN